MSEFVKIEAQIACFSCRYHTYKGAEEVKDTPLQELYDTQSLWCNGAKARNTEVVGRTCPAGPCVPFRGS